jgi:hypothetical protein
LESKNEKDNKYVALFGGQLKDEYRYFGKNPTSPIGFVSKVAKMDKVDGPKTDKSEWIKLEFLMDPDNPASNYSRQFAIFKDGFRVPEEWIKWVMAFREIENLMPLNDPVEKTRMFWTLLKGQVLTYFENPLRKRVETEDSEIPDNELIELMLRDVDLEYIVKHTIHMQKYYVKRCFYMGLNTSVQQFVERLNDLNCFLLYFPEKTSS